MVTHSSILAWEIPWESHSLMVYSPWGSKELDTTEHLGMQRCIKSCRNKIALEMIGLYLKKVRDK